MYVNCCSQCLNKQVVKARGPAFPDKYRRSAASWGCFELDTVSSENKTTLLLFHLKYPLVRKISWWRKWQPTPVFLPGKSHGQRSLAGYSPRGRKESDMTEHARTHPLVDKPLRRAGDKRSFLYWNSKMLLTPVLTCQSFEWPQHIFWVFVLPVHAFEVGFHRVTSQKTEKGEGGRNAATPGVFLQEGPGASGKDAGGPGTASSKPRAARRGRRMLKSFLFLNWLVPIWAKVHVPLLRWDLSACSSFLKCFVLHNPQVEWLLLLALPVTGRRPHPLALTE